MSFFAVESPYIVRNLREELKLRRQELTDHLASGSAPDYAAYRQQVGAINQTTEILNLLDDMEKEERKRNGSR